MSSRRDLRGITDMAVQRHERQAFYHLPVYCGLCGQLVLGADEAEISPCQHTLYIAHDEGFAFVSERAEQVLATLSCNVVRHDDDYLEFEFATDEDVRNIDELTDAVEFPDALKVASYTGPPGVFGSYVGFAPTEGE
jgi:hypothetical protein